MEDERKRGEEAKVWFGIQVKLRIVGWLTSHWWRRVMVLLLLPAGERRRGGSFEEMG